jgi:preprotein translocase subunit SecB
MDAIGAPFQFLDYHIEQLTLDRFHPDIDEAPDHVGTALGFGMEIRRVDDVEEDVYEVQLDLHLNDDEDAIPEDERDQVFHRAHLTIVGRFQWLEDAKPSDEEEADKLLLVNGLSMLYGTARVHLRQLTDPGPEPVLHIPSISFKPIVEQALKG